MNSIIHNIPNLWVNENFNSLTSWTENDPNGTLTVSLVNPGVNLSGGAFTIASRNITYNTTFNSNVKSFEMRLFFTPTSGTNGGITIGMRNNTVNGSNPSRWVAARISQSTSPCELSIWSGNGSTSNPDEQTQRIALTTGIAVSANTEYILSLRREYNGILPSATYTATLYHTKNINVPASVVWIETAANTQSQAQMNSMRVMVGLVNGPHFVKNVTCELF